jgi:hypothetical protein
MATRPRTMSTGAAGGGAASFPFFHCALGRASFLSARIDPVKLGARRTGVVSENR